MTFHGLQKLTLLDYPQHLACTLFTSGCNFRCPFCQNGELVRNEPFETFTQEQILAFLKTRQNKLDGVCVTGGEPLIHDLTDFLRAVKRLGFAVKLDTNGSYPERLKALIGAGLVDYVAMDIKSSKDGYNAAAGCCVDLKKIEESVAFLLTGSVPYEFRTTVVKELHPFSALEEIAVWLQGAAKYVLQNYVDSEYVLSRGTLTAYDEETLRDFVRRLQNILPSVELRGV